jgi:serine/threonine-protein kinase
MGIVRQYFDRQIGREVAIKRLHPGGDAGRFEREARLQAQLEHPAIVPVHDLGVDDDGRLWFSMKRIRGLTLERILDGLARNDPSIVARYSRTRLLNALCTACLAVDFAHQHGVLHRDLKPGNIMMGDFGEVHVLDWGIARVSSGGDPSGPDPDAGSDVRATAVGSVVGTPGYMSPEQARADVDRLDARADVYALGAILFEILTLRPLHRGSTPADLLAETLAGRAVRPSAGAPERDIPPELDEVCVRATSDLAVRTASARELCDAIEKYLDGDRDVEHRRALALEQTSAAKGLYDRCLARGPDGLRARADVMRHLTRAVALDPAAKDAPALMARLLMEPPAEAPEEVEREMGEIAHGERLLGVRMSLLSNALWMALVPLVLWMGLRDVRPGVVSAVAFVLVTAVAVWQLRRRKVTAESGIVQLALTALLVASQCTLLGSLVLVPTLALAIGVFFALLGGASNRPQRLAIILGASFAMLGPALLEWADVLPDPYRIEASHIEIRAQVAWFSPVATRVFMVVTHVLAVAIPMVLVLRAREMMTRAQRRLLTHAWHLRQLVPDLEAARRPAS